MSDFETQNNPDLGNGNEPTQPNPPVGQEPQYGYQPDPQAGYQQNPQPNNGQPQYGQPPYDQPPYGQPQNNGQPPYGDPNQYSNDPNQPYAPYPGQPFQQTINIQTPPVYVNQKSKIAAGLLGIFLGSLGVHNFYLGYTGKAVAQLLIALLTCGMGAAITGIWGLIEGIMILTGSIAVDGQGIPLRD